MECDAKPEPQPKKDEPEKPQTAPETSKPTSETKSSGVKVVRGNKKIKLDNSEQSQPDKKGTQATIFLHPLFRLVQTCLSLTFCLVHCSFIQIESLF